MTVYNSYYSSIEDAWGTPDLAGRSKKKKKQPVQDPICDLYESKVNSKAFSETDIVNMAADQYEKSKYQKNASREPSKRYAFVTPETNYYDVSKNLFEKQFEVHGEKPTLATYDEDDEEWDNRPVLQERYAARQEASPPTSEEYHVVKPRKYFDDHIENIVYQEKSKHVPYLDILVYICSGILLIFLLEQFIKIGQNLQLNNVQF